MNYKDFIKDKQAGSGPKGFVPATNPGPMKPKSGSKTDPRRGDAIKRRLGQSNKVNKKPWNYGPDEKDGLDGRGIPGTKPKIRTRRKFG